MHQAKAVFMMVVYDTPESWLRQAIESVLQQTCPDLYLLIQDNGSTGRTAGSRSVFYPDSSTIVVPHTTRSACFSVAIWYITSRKSGA